MPRPLEVRVSPVKGRVHLGGTASFVCDTKPMDRDSVHEFSWEAAVQIANETRYEFDDARRRIVHIMDVQGRDNNTNVVCEVRTATGRKGKGTAKIVVKAREIASMPTARPTLPGSFALRKLGVQSQFHDSPCNCLTLGVSLGGVILLLLCFMIVAKLFGYAAKKRHIKRPDKNAIRKNTKKNQDECFVPEAGDVERIQTNASTGEIYNTFYEDLGPNWTKGCSASLPTRFGYEHKAVFGSRLSMTSDYGTYENLSGGVSLGYPSPNEWNRPACSSSLAIQYTHHTQPTVASFHSVNDLYYVDSCYIRPGLLEMTCDIYENVQPTEPVYENLQRGSYTTYADLDFGDSSNANVTDHTSIDSNSVEYSRILQILSVFRSRRGSITVKVIETGNDEASK